MKNILIIGGSSGIGAALVEIISQKEDHQLIATYNSTTPSKFNNTIFYHYDVLDKNASLNELPDVIHGLVYCPGSINLKPFQRITDEEYIKDLQLHVFGAVKVIRENLNALRKGNASIVLYSTIAVQSGFKFHSSVAISKGAIEGLTKSLAAEFAPKIRVNAIAPSLTDTPLASKLLSDEAKKEANGKNHPLQRVGEAVDIANLTEFLLSEKSSWMTGQILHIDGGLSTLKL
ncbi:SDR family oxidoreductase [Flammeovirga sp. MY04]|uniref:SDR family NAD(P)-dependent oxidoreductase n=1 Tax=Flammeovirga sp. MY04 TaxID=1191459 RepID=UPI000806386C|nr:SDR family oxidoreductase [Flammeovirga sp. MY04]ANQ52103.1 SDR family oxidoreductase [Flammeovirga sp. MY04]